MHVMTKKYRNKCTYLLQTLALALQRAPPHPTLSIQRKPCRRGVSTTGNFMAPLPVLQPHTTILLMYVVLLLRSTIYVVDERRITRRPPDKEEKKGSPATTHENTNEHIIYRCTSRQIVRHELACLKA